ncbi:TIGR02281 family clan AA aspartic protease [Neptuniibacter sp.]|uniref:retropepsin-like aspartic protease family protein n=1 Tax=Neptuniibacter sp. TaxID=1962643 RepID=UPI002635F90A|nr:TIGR02281 family clan AA aspartic protease [Neptuniibacter sp.]MCP4595073.1 TIGR02281 family clan AA aspartic protease [Neptuniibacter sp.]
MEPKNTSKKIGQGMWAVAWVILLGLLYLYFDKTVADKYNPNRALTATQSNAPVVLKRNRSGHYIAPGKINGVKVTFLLDTGATTISVPQSVADEIGLLRGHRQQVGTANGTIDVYASELDTVQLGSITLQNIRGHINPHMEGKTVLLGMSFMRHLEMTQKGDTLTLRP